MSNQPNENHDKCAAMWSEFAGWRWRDAFCSYTGRCLCERQPAIPGDQPTADYQAFASAEAVQYNLLRSLAFRWLLIVYLAIVPIVSLLPFVVARCGRRYRCRLSKAPPSTSATTAGQGEPVASGEEEMIQYLRASGEAAKRLRRRVAGWTIFVSWATFVTAFIPVFLPLAAFPEELFRGWALVVGNVTMILQGILPWSAIIAGLALRPIDTVEICRASRLYMTVLLMGGVIIFSSLSRDRTPAEDIGAGSEANDNYNLTYPTLGFALLAVSLIGHALLLVPSSFPGSSLLTPREQLRRLWLFVRSSTLFAGIYFLLVFLTPVYRGGAIIFTGRLDDMNLQYLLVCIFYLLAATITTPAVRGHTFRWVGSFNSSGSKEQEAAVVAALISSNSLSAADAYVVARQLFRGLPLTKLLSEGLSTILPAGADRHGMRADGALLQLTEPAALGDVEAFVSYTWKDNRDAQLACLGRWIEEVGATDAQGQPRKIWIDRACMDNKDVKLNLMCLPIFLAGCKKLLVLAGPAYASRLWCAMELYTFVRVGSKRADIDVRLCSQEEGPEGGHGTRELIQRELALFDAEKARCFFDADRQRLLAVIESTFGTAAPFNRIVRSLVQSQD